MRYFSLTLVHIALLLASCKHTPAPPEFSVLSPVEASTLIKQGDVIIVDVRTPEEFALGKIDQALNIDFYNDNFAEELAKLDKNETYLMYCGKGSRSANTLNMMKDLQFDKVYDLEGGFEKWQAAMK